MIKDNEIQYKNTLVLNMFELTKFLDFGTEYSPGLGDEDVLICLNKEGKKDSHLDMVGLIPLKGKVLQEYYDILKNYYNTGDISTYKLFNTKEESVNYINTVVISGYETYLFKLYDENYDTYVYEDLEGNQITLKEGFIPLKGYIDEDDYSKLEYWWTINSTNPSIILERGDFLFNLHEFENTDNKKIQIKLTSKQFDEEDLDYIMGDLEYFKSEHPNVKIELKLMVMISDKSKITIDDVIQKLLLSRLVDKIF